jgi:predicted secreted Zn-dependent protease
MKAILSPRGAFCVLLLFAAGMTSPASAATISKSYSYFTIRSATLPELEEELNRRGPEVKSTGQRHPGATRLEFQTVVDYVPDGRGCRVGEVAVTVQAKIILPRWKSRAKPDRESRIIWNTLSADIKRHEERHVEIARNHARELEQTLTGLDKARDCDRLATQVARVTDRILKSHDEAQSRFDRVEGINFEARLFRLLRYRLEQIGSGRIAE